MLKVIYVSTRQEGEGRWESGSTGPDSFALTGSETNPGPVMATNSSRDVGMLLVID